MRNALTVFIAAIGPLVLSACVSVPSRPAAAFEIAQSLACTPDQLANADPSCLVLTDPRVSDSADRATLIADALAAAGYAPIKLWAVPVSPGDRVIGFSAVQDAGPCFRRRDCGAGFPYYIAVALQDADGGLSVIDPAVLDAPADPVAWVSTLVLGGKSLVDVRYGTMEADETAAGVQGDGRLALAPASVDAARVGLKSAYCNLPGRRAEFQGTLALRGYDRPRKADPSCETS